MYKRKTTGLKKKNGTTTRVEKPSIKLKSTVDIKNVLVVNDENTKEDKESHKDNGSSGNITPKQCTPKRNDSSSKKESPCTPLYSPNLQPLFPRTFGSPEIEVSWDWGCSQVPKDMLPSRRAKRLSSSQPPPIIFPTVPLFQRFPPNKQMSEEENQERLAFYKNVLSKSLKGETLKDSVDLRNNNIDKELITDTTTETAKNGSYGSVINSGKKDEQINNYFDDSANEFMLECSQAIEEQLKNGELSSGAIISVKLPTQKHGHSPVEVENARKKVCHGKSKLNLFPEAPNKVDLNANGNHAKKVCLSLRSPKNKLLKTGSGINNKTFRLDNERNRQFENDDDILFIRPTQVNKGLVLKKDSTSSGTVNNDRDHQRVIHAMNNLTKLEINGTNTNLLPNDVKYSLQGNMTSTNSDKQPLSAKQRNSNNNNFVNGSNHNIHEPKLSNVTSVNNDSVKKFFQGQNNKTTSNNFLSSPKVKHIRSDASSGSIPESRTILRQNSTLQQYTPELTNLKDEKPVKTDLESLLDDGLDMELSSLDFDSLCCSSQPETSLVVKPETKPFQPVTKTFQPVIKPAQKICSQQEIEAKRLAALNRLMKKKKR